MIFFKVHSNYSSVVVTLFQRQCANGKQHGLHNKNSFFMIFYLKKNGFYCPL